MALHPLDTQYSQPADSPQPHGLRSTYDLPSTFVIDYACQTSQRVSLQRLQDRAKSDRSDRQDRSSMIMDSSSSSEGRASFGIIKRSVPGMRSLMPLKLLSPRLPESDIWPSPEPVKRSTFGTNINFQDLDYSSDIGDRARDSLKTRKRSRQYRDTPIYSEAGSPIPSRAYFSDDDISFNCSQPASLYEEDRVIGDFASFKQFETDDSVENGEDDDAQRTPCTIQNLSQRPSAIPRPRWSELSFQCSGEALYANESVWLRSPKAKKDDTTRDILDDDDDDFTHRTVESWLSDTRSSFEHEEEILACATALSPSRAQVIDLSVNPNRHGDLPLRIPARSSSLMGTFIPANNYWETFGTPPITPSGPWSGETDMISHLSQVNKDNHVLSKHLDISMQSPPLSPHRSSSIVARAIRSPKKRAAMHVSTNELDSQWPLPPVTTSQPSLTDIISSLEASVSSFPSSILLPDTPCISAIRSRELRHESVPVTSECPISTSSLRSPFGQEFPLPPSYRPSGKPRPFKLPSRNQNPNFSSPIDSSPHNSSSMRSSSLPIVMPSYLYPPDLTPLTRIFPKTSDFMRSVLYAHVIAHTFVTSLSTRIQGPHLEHPSRRRRDTPHWNSTPLSPKAANILGIAFQDSDPAGESAEKQLQFKIRLQALQQTLRRCIYCLTSVMDSDLGIEDVPELDDNGSGCNNGKLFIRTLEEVVRSCETGLYGLGGMV